MLQKALRICCRYEWSLTEGGVNSERGKGLVEREVPASKGGGIYNAAVNESVASRERSS